MEDAVFYRGVAANRGTAGTIQRMQQRPLGGGHGTGFGILDGGEKLMKFGAFGANRNAYDALARGGEHDLGRKDDTGAAGQAQALQAGQCEQTGIDFAASHAVEAGLDVTTKQGDPQIGADGEELRLAADRAGADQGGGRERVERIGLIADFGVGGKDQHIASVFAFQGAGEHDTWGQRRLEVLQAVDGEIDPAVE